MPPKPVEKIQVSALLPKDLVRLLDQEAGKSGGLSRSAALYDIVRKFFRGKIGGRSGRSAAYAEAVREAKELKERGALHLDDGNLEKARQHFLRAASKELEALSILVDPTETVIRAVVIEVVSLLKDGTGYNHLPTVPPRHKGTGINTV